MIKHVTIYDRHQALMNYYSEVADTSVGDAIGDIIDPFIKVGEGAYDALIRVVTDTGKAKYLIEKLGEGFEEVNFKSLEESVKQGDVAAELLRESILNVESVKTLEIPTIVIDQDTVDATVSGDTTISLTGITAVDINEPVLVRNLNNVGELINDFQGQQMILDFEGSMLTGVENFYQSFGAYAESYYYFKKRFIDHV
mgnify:CR=1 FL=1